MCLFMHDFYNSLGGNGQTLYLNFSFPFSCKYGATCRYNHPERTGMQLLLCFYFKIEMLNFSI